MRKFTDWGPAFLVLTATVVALFFAPSMVRRVEFAQTSARVSLARQALGEDDILLRIDQATRRIAEAVGPTVTHIDVTVSGSGRWRSSSSGSGWVFDEDGHVVTNAHVLRRADDIRVQLSDGRIYDADLVGADPLTDIAVLKLPRVDGLIAAERATDRQPRQGERVFAFGSPFGFKFSMSEGIISGLGREPAGAVATSSGYTNFIQTDAAVNPGNSGGPLVDVRGRVVGMNVAIATGSDNDGTSAEGQSAGISFAIPLPVIESVVGQIIESGTVRRGYLGINLPNSRRPLGGVNFNGFGVVVPDLPSDGPAARAGVEVQDVITAINGQTATGVGVLRSLISTLQPGEVAELTVWRRGEELTIPVVLEQAGQEVSVGPSIIEELRSEGLILVSRPDQWDTAAVVIAVIEGSPAEAAGFEVGQVIERVEGRRVRTLRDLADRLASEDLLLGQAVEVSVRGMDADTGDRVERTISLQISR